VLFTMTPTEIFLRAMVALENDARGFFHVVCSLSGNCSITCCTNLSLT
jgi:hypothetical protein